MEETLAQTPTQTQPSEQQTDPQTAVTTVTNGDTKPLTSENGGENPRRRRRSRWDPQEEGPNNGTETEPKKRKSRWEDDDSSQPKFQLPDFMKDFSMETDPEIQILNLRLLEISRTLQANLPLDDRPEGARSPSPEPVYDNMGIRINTREFRARERLNKERQDIITQIIKRNPNYKPPADYRPPKLHKKLFIPVKDFPGYNFIGLIIGPRGNTQKRMEKETGAKIVIRGKGSMKEGKLGQKKDLKYDLAENEDLHVLVEADTQEALDAAADMVEKLLRPVDETLNEHKRQQLKELAALNGTIREDEFCRLCGEQGHRQYACPARTSTFKSDVLCKICGDGGHPTIDCPVKGTTGKKMDDEYQNFLAELGGTVPEGVSRPTAALPLPGSGGSGSTPPWVSGSNSGGSGPSAHPGLGSTILKTGKEIDDTNLYIGYLPPTFDDDALIQLFSPFGSIVTAKVIKDRVTGLSKGYGFVKYSDISQANQAISSMSGYQLDGRTIAVRVAGRPPQPPPAPAPPAHMTPAYPGPNSSAAGYPMQHVAPGGYMGAPPPWASQAPPYAPYGSAPNMYNPVQGQYMPPYGGQYPPVGSSGMPPQYMPPGETGPPGVQPQTSESSTATNNIYPGFSGAMPPNSQPSYPPSSYYAPPPPPPAVSSTMEQQNYSSAPWGSNYAPPPPPPPSGEQPQQNTYGADTEYEKFMAEMK